MVSADDLTSENFILAIKNMDPRERKKIRADKLLDLILSYEPSQIMEKRIAEIEVKLDMVNKKSEKNEDKISSLESTSRNNSAPTLFSSDPPSIEHRFNELEKQITGLRQHLFDIEQYLRVNNVEIVGLPEPNENESNEDVIVNCLKSK